MMPLPIYSEAPIIRTRRRERYLRPRLSTALPVNHCLGCGATYQHPRSAVVDPRSHPKGIDNLPRLLRHASMAPCLGERNPVSWLEYWEGPVKRDAGFNKGFADAI
jgi:hypothetical protein